MAVLLGDEVGASCFIRNLLSSNLNSEQFAEMAEEEHCEESYLPSPPILADMHVSADAVWYTTHTDTHETLNF